MPRGLPSLRRRRQSAAPLRANPSFVRLFALEREFAFLWRGAAVFRLAALFFCLLMVAKRREFTNLQLHFSLLEYNGVKRTHCPLGCCALLYCRSKEGEK